MYGETRGMGKRSSDTGMKEEFLKRHALDGITFEETTDEVLESRVHFTAWEGVCTILGETNVVTSLFDPTKKFNMIGGTEGGTTNDELVGDSADGP